MYPCMILIVEIFIQLNSWNLGVFLILKKRFVTRNEWTRILERQCNQAYISDAEYKGNITLLKCKRTVMENLSKQIDLYC